MTPARASFVVFYLSALFYVFVLSGAGLAERMKLNKELDRVTGEVERLILENQGLEEKERRLKNDSYALEKEARKYYLLSENAYVLKFEDPILPVGEEKGRIQKANVQAELSVPPLSLIRFFYLSFSVFLVLGVYWKLKRLPHTSNSKRLI
ncbi:septum formation initiator family protein [Leptospira sp. 96542]|nr:septum formation initiator family protein [Leptospira sp. 96542]